jgi:hypothetical protein
LAFPFKISKSGANIAKRTVEPYRLHAVLKTLPHPSPGDGHFDQVVTFSPRSLPPSSSSSSSSAAAAAASSSPQEHRIELVVIDKPEKEMQVTSRHRCYAVITSLLS